MRATATPGRRENQSGSKVESNSRIKGVKRRCLEE